MDKFVVQKVIDRALSMGGDFAELYLEDNDSSTIEMLSGKVENAITGRTHGAGIRIFDGLRSIYVYTNDTSEQGLTDAALQAASAVGASRKAGDIVLNVTPHVQRSPIKVLPSSVEMARKAEMLRAGNAVITGYSPKIVQSRMGMLDWSKEILIANSEGLFTQTNHTYTRAIMMAVASDGKEMQTGYEGPGAQKGMEFYDTLDIEAYAKEAARVAVTSLEADLCPAGRMPVAIQNGFGGVIFHEACGHSLEAAFISKGTSVFTGKMGEKIASELVTAIDDGTLPNAWGSSDVDDEGTPTQRNVLIENGVLKSYLVDKLSARRMGGASNGAGRRQSYKYAPTSRMSNTFIAPGTDDDDEIISSMGDGLYCAKMGGGSVDVETGDFNFAVSEAYIVRDGKIVKPVRGATLIGKGSEILKKIDRVGKYMKTGQGMCGAASGSIPADVGQPLIRVSEITVGGYKED